MICASKNHQWLGLFSVALMRLRSGVSLPLAVMRAVSAHAHLSDLPPEEAAAIEAEVMARQVARKATRVAANDALSRRQQHRA